MSKLTAKCPHCQWQERGTKDWNCLECGQDLDQFANLGRCEHCGYNHRLVYCPEEYGGCGQSSPLIEWYGNLDQGLEDLGIYTI